MVNDLQSVCPSLCRVKRVSGVMMRMMTKTNIDSGLSSSLSTDIGQHCHCNIDLELTTSRTGKLTSWTCGWTVSCSETVNKP